MAYQMTTTAVTLNDLEGHSPVAGLLKCNPSNICAAFYMISTHSALAELLVQFRLLSDCMMRNLTSALLDGPS